MRNLAFLAVLLLGCIPLLFSFPSWEKPLQPVSIHSPIGVVSHPQTPDRFFIASDRAIFSGNPKSGWSLIWSLPHSKYKIRKLHLLKNNPDIVFALANSGLYQIDVR